MNCSLLDFCASFSGAASRNFTYAVPPNLRSYPLIIVMIIITIIHESFGYADEEPFQLLILALLLKIKNNNKTKIYKAQ